MTLSKKRFLATGFKSGTTFEDLPDGGLIVRDVPLLKEGTWTDSAVGTPLFYPSETLRAFAANWKDDRYLGRHSGGIPLYITDKVGSVKNPRFQGDGIYGDLRLHGATTASRDAISYLKWASENDEEVFSSVEHAGEEVYNAEAKRMEAKTLVFYGAAMVNRGACQTCQIPRTNEEQPTEEPEEEFMVEEAEFKKLSDSVAALTTIVEDIVNERKQKALEESAAEQEKALADAITEQTKALEERLKALEETGTPQTPGSPAAAILEDPINRDLEYDSKGGIRVV